MLNSQNNNKQVERAWNYLERRFGVTKEAPVVDGLTLKYVSDDIWLATADADADLQVKTYGIRCIRVQDIGLKPTTYALQLLADALQKHVVDLSRDQFVALLEGEHVPVDDTDLTSGYVALQWNDRVMGCGLYRNGTVSSRIPKGRAQELLRYIDREDG